MGFGESLSFLKILAMAFSKPHYGNHTPIYFDLDSKQRIFASSSEENSGSGRSMESLTPPSGNIGSVGPRIMAGSILSSLTLGASDSSSSPEPESSADEESKF